MSDLVAISGVNLTKTGLVLASDLSIDDWVAVGKKLVLASGAIQWWLGDWMTYGEKRYEPGMYSEALNAFDYDRHTLYDYASVARKVRSSLRNEDLSWNHHRAVTALDEDQQEAMLTKAETEELSVQGLREEVKRTYQPQLVEEAERIAQEQARLESFFKQPVVVRWLGGDRKPFFTVQLKFEEAPDVEAFANTLNQQKA